MTKKSFLSEHTLQDAEPRIFTGAFGRMNKILTMDRHIHTVVGDSTIRAMAGATYGSPAWSIGDNSIYIDLSHEAVKRTPQGSQERYLLLCGLNYHELGHIFYSHHGVNKNLSEARRHFPSAMMMLEDAKIEMQMVTRWPSTLPYLTNTAIHVLWGAPNRQDGQILLLLARLYLPVVYRNKIAKLLSIPLTADFERIIREFIPLNWRTNGARMLELCEEMDAILGKYTQSSLTKFDMIHHGSRGGAAPDTLPKRVVVAALAAVPEMDLPDPDVESDQPDEDGEDREEEGPTIATLGGEESEDEDEDADWIDDGPGGYDWDEGSEPALDEDDEPTSDESKGGGSGAEDSEEGGADQKATSADGEGEGAGEASGDLEELEESLEKLRDHLTRRDEKLAGDDADDLAKSIIEDLSADTRDEFGGFKRQVFKDLRNSLPKANLSLRTATYRPSKDYDPDPVLTRSFVRTFSKMLDASEPGWNHRESYGNRVDLLATLRDPLGSDIWTRWDEGAEDDFGFEVVVLLDRSGSMERSVASLNSATASLIEALGKFPNVSLTVMDYAGGVRLLYSTELGWKPTTRPFISAIGTTVPYDAFLTAGAIFEASRKKHSLLLVMTDGEWVPDGRGDAWALARQITEAGAHTVFYFYEPTGWSSQYTNNILARAGVCFTETHAVTDLKKMADGMLGVVRKIGGGRR